LIVLTSFANTPLRNGFIRLKREADSFHVFDKIYFYTEKELDIEFQKKFRFLMRPYSRGFGYWCWKPQVIAQTLKMMSDGDMLLYMDIGSHLNLSGKSRFMDYIEIVRKSTVGVLAFRSPQHLDKRYSKIDVFRYFGVESNDFYINTTQIEATHIFFRKCEESVSLVDEWLKALLNDYTIFTDLPSKDTEYQEYERNTGDQSVFSILAKKYNIETLSTDETWASDWSLLNKYPLLAKRDKALNYWWQRKYSGMLAKYYKLLWHFIYGDQIK